LPTNQLHIAKRVHEQMAREFVGYFPNPRSSSDKLSRVYNGGVGPCGYFANQFFSGGCADKRTPLSIPKQQAQPIGGYVSTRDKVQRSLEALGIEVTNGTSPGVRLARRGGEGAKVSKGASGTRTSARSKGKR
jgi:hypothetical protein